MCASRRSRPSLRLALLAATGIGLAGCAARPLPALRPPLPAGWHQPAGPADAPAADLHGWWHAFGDASLDRLVDQALAGNPGIAQARERLIASRTLYGATGAGFAPHLRGKTEDAIDPDASASFLVVGFDALWEPGLFGRRTSAERQARGNLQASAADLQAARVSLVAEVTREWLALRGARASERWQGRVVAARGQLLARMRTRARLGLESPTAVARAQASLAQAQADLTTPRADAIAAAQRLAVLLGRPEPDPAWLATTTLPRLRGMRIQAAPADLLRSRPDIARAEAGVLRAAGDAGIDRADLLPRIGLAGSLVWATNLATNRRVNGDNALLSIGPLLDIPLFDWGMREAQLHASEHALKAAVLAYRAAVLEGVGEVETALGRLHQAGARERASHQAFEALDQAWQVTARRATLGLASPVERAESAVARGQAALAWLQAREARDLAYVALFKALGGAPLPDTAAADADAGAP